MKIEIRNKSVIYIEMDGIIFYIDNSTGEAIMENWTVKNEESV